MLKLKPFELSDEVVQKMRETRCLPARLYNQDGQTVIFPRSNLDEAEIEKLLRFRTQGLFYHPDDAAHLGLVEAPPAPPLSVVSAPLQTVSKTPNLPEVEGLSSARLISQALTNQTLNLADDLLSEVKVSPLTAKTSLALREGLDQVASDFLAQPDVTTGVVNVLERLAEIRALPAQEMAIKRTVVSLALKSRLMPAAAHRNPDERRQNLSDLLTSALLCDIGFTRMTPVDRANLSPEDAAYLKTHPFLSYLLIANEENLGLNVKYNVLNHHRALVDPSRESNNYPQMSWLKTKLQGLVEAHQADPENRLLVEDSRLLLARFDRGRERNEDLEILSVASEFASLTTETSWRLAWPAERALQMMVNNSWFTHSGRIMGDFLDRLAVSLNQNQLVVKPGAFVVLNSTSQDQRQYWEVCQVLEAGREQSQPLLRRLGTGAPHIITEPKRRLAGLVPSSLHKERSIHLDLKKDQSRRLIYCLNEEFDNEFYKAVKKLA